MERKVMSFLSYKILRSTCLGFSKELQVVITSDVLQHRLPTGAMGLLMILRDTETGGRGGWGGKEKKESKKSHLEAW